MTTPKKIFLASSIALIVALLLWGIYILSFKQVPMKETTPKKAIETVGVSQEIAGQKESKISVLVDEAILAPTLSINGDTIKYYSKISGKAFEIDIVSHTIRTLSVKELSNLANVAWSPDKSKVISSFPINSSNFNFFFYDYAKNVGTQLKNNLDSVIWQNNNKIIYKYFNSATKERTLNIADPDGSNWKKIINLSLRDIRIAPIPKTGLISFWNKPDSFTEASLQTVPAFGGEIKNISTSRFGADYLWSADGNLVLESHVETKGGAQLQLSVMNSLGGEYKALSIPTLISKCAWSNNNRNIYYALPGSIPDTATMPNDYLANKFSTSDTFWMVNISTGEKTRLVDLNKINQAYDASELFLSPDESMLFFVNKIDSKLYQISL